MGKGLPRSMSRGNAKRQEWIKVIVPIESVGVTVDGASGVGWGTSVIGDLPEGNLLFSGAIAYVKLTTTEASGVVATYNGDYAIGTAPTANGDVSGTGEANIIASTSIGPAVAKVTPLTRGEGGGALSGVIFDNTDNSLEINLNVLIDDADISADDKVFTADGHLVMMYTVLSDD